MVEVWRVVVEGITVRDRVAHYPGDAGLVLLLLIPCRRRVAVLLCVIVPAAVAAKVAAALSAVTATYASAVSIVNRVVVTFAAAGLRTKIFDVNTAGIAATSEIQTVGDANFTIAVYDEIVGLTYGDTAATVNDKIYSVFNGKIDKYMNVTKPTGTTTTYTFIDYGAKFSVTTQTISGVTIGTAVGTPGDGAINLNLLGQTPGGAPGGAARALRPR